MNTSRKENNMRKYINSLAVICIAVMASGCALRLSGVSTPSLSPTPAVNRTAAASTAAPTASTSSTTTPVVTATATEPPDFCADPQPKALIDSFKNALQTSNESLFAALVSPLHGLELRLYRSGPVFNYDRQQAQSLFDSTDRMDWGTTPSGWETKGSFKDAVVPVLLKVFNKDYLLDCDQIQIGGATYKAVWPYAGVSFYSVYYPGNPANNNLDWRTWLLGMEYVNGKPYLYAIMQFLWEP